MASNFLKIKIKTRLWFRGGFIILLTLGILGYELSDYITSSWPTMAQDANDSPLSIGRELASNDDSSCVQPANPKGLAFLYCLGVLYMFIGLAIIADDFFVPALDVISERLELSPDVAGATLMAAGGSAPELFTSAVGTFLRSDVGFGAIVGSAVFNVLFVVGICAILTSKPMQLTWWPMIRDSSYYIIVLVLLALFFGVISPQIIEWWEALILHLMYYLYVYLMKHNIALKNFFVGLVKCSHDKDTPLSEQIVDNNDNRMMEEPLFFHSATKFRAGILQLLLSNKSILDTAGISIVSKINGTVEEIFRKVDKDGSGYIDSDELTAVLQNLECPGVDSNSIKAIFSEVDKDGDGKIDLEEFTHWYLASEHRIHSEVDNCFKKIDIDGDGSIQASEIVQVLQLLQNNKPVADEDAKKIVDEVAGGDNPTSITLEAFRAWYQKSMFYGLKRQQSELEQEASEGLSIYPPEDASLISVAMFWYVMTLPLVLLFILTLVDVRQPGKAKYATFTFLVCLAWMGIFSYLMVSWVEIIGATAGIPDVIMGLTFLAAGTSVPDMLSAVIVAKQGEGDKAVSSSIGSNVFDICVGLAFPWLLFWAVYQEAVFVSADSLFISILTIAVAMFLVIGSLRLRNWLLPPSTGYFFIFLYCCFVGEQLGLASWGDC